MFSSQLKSLTPKSVAQEPLLIRSRQCGTNPFLALEERTGTERLGCALGDKKEKQCSPEHRDISPEPTRA